MIGKTDEGKNLEIDVPRLIETRMLIEANSGGGKSYLIRKILEETHGKVQQIVLDMEGEFSTLREKFDYILAGKTSMGADIAADPRSADLLARRVLELGTSIIIDLYELKHEERIRFVKNFCEALINSPKELWHPVLVIIDEAHIFCPEKGESEAMGAVIDLATRGRKRGFGCILATQRLSKLHKDAAAEMINKLIGRTSLDIDMKRASDELGFTSKQQMQTLRELEPGEFYAFGPALSKEIVKVKVGEVQTTHPRAGQRAISVTPKPTEKVLKSLAKLVDLPKEAEKELKTKEEMQRMIRDLKMQLRAKPKPEVDESEIKRISGREYEKGFKDSEQNWKKAFDELKVKYSRTIATLNRVATAIGSAEQRPIEIKEPEKPIYRPAYIPKKTTGAQLHFQKPQQIEPQTTEFLPEGGQVKYGRCEKMILKFLLTQPERYFTKSQIGAMTGYSATSGGVSSAISILRTQKLVNQNGTSLKVNSSEIERASEICADIDLPSLKDWLGKLPAQARKVFDVLYKDPEHIFTKEEIGEQTGYSATSGGLSSAISNLHTLGLIEKTEGGIKFNSAIEEWMD